MFTDGRTDGRTDGLCKMYRRSGTTYRTSNYLGPQYISTFINLSKGKGIAAYYPNTFKSTGEFYNSTYQMITIESHTLAITNIYRAHYATETFNIHLKKCLTAVGHKDHLIIGDFNLCIRKDINHEVMNILKEHGYKTINSIFHKPPEPTQIKGRCIDQAWIRLVSNKLSLIDHSIKTCVYSDHEKLKIELKLY